MASIPRITVIGSSNIDMVVRTPRFPKPGETILGSDFFMNQGGKGANQAVAAARLNSDVTFVSSVGDDIFGKTTLKTLKQEGIDVSLVLIEKEVSTGVAVITVDQHAENTIVVSPGANAELVKEKLKHIPSFIDEGAYVLMQLEIPIATVQYLAEEIEKRKAKLILNPAPAQSLSPEIFSMVYLLTPNETEASLLTGLKIEDIDSAKIAAARLIEMGVKNVVITMGNKGAVALYNKEYIYVEAQKVNAVDTTAAGDVFNGALIVALNEGKTMLEALTFANNAASIAVTRLGAQSSSPHRKELDKYCKTIKKQL